MERFICERRASICYKDNNVFRKYYKYANEKEVVQEGINSIRASESGIYTPEYIKNGYSQERDMYFNEYSFHDIKKVNIDMITPDLIEQIRKILEKMPKEAITDIYWKAKYVPDLLSVLSYIPDDHRLDVRNYILDMTRKNANQFIHGDFSFENIGIEQNSSQLIIYDFQASGCGIENWDFAYLLGSIPWEKSISIEIDDDVSQLIKVVTAIKYARGIRKKFEIGERKDNYEYWWKYD